MKNKIQLITFTKNKIVITRQENFGRVYRPNNKRINKLFVLCEKHSTKSSGDNNIVDYLF